jgi:hypothetical protein
MVVVIDWSGAKMPFWATIFFWNQNIKLEQSL